MWKNGYNKNGVQCQNNNECVLGFCSDDATCNNTEGTFSRSCKTGYKEHIDTAYVGQVCGHIEECGTF